MSDDNGGGWYGESERHRRAALKGQHGRVRGRLKDLGRRLRRLFNRS